MPSASDNHGVYPYPLVKNLQYANVPAPERALGERTGEIDYAVNVHPVKGIQPGFDIAGIPLAGMDASALASLAGPQP